MSVFKAVPMLNRFDVWIASTIPWLWMWTFSWVQFTVRLLLLFFSFLCMHCLFSYSTLLCSYSKSSNSISAAYFQLKKSDTNVHILAVHYPFSWLLFIYWFSCTDESISCFLLKILIAVFLSNWKSFLLFQERDETGRNMQEKIMLDEIM